MQDSTGLPTVLFLEESVVNDEVKEEARVSVEHFLQVKDTRKMYVSTDENKLLITQHFVIFFSRN